MTHPIVHFLVPVIGLLLLKFDKRLVLLLSPLALIPDIDYFIPPHRGWGHSIFFAILLILIAYYGVKRLFPEYMSKQVLIVAGVMIFSHLIMDGEMAWLYPMSEARFGYRWDLGSFVWEETTSGPKEYFSLGYQMLQITAILFSALVAFFFWPSSARSR